MIFSPKCFPPSYLHQPEAVHEPAKGKYSLPNADDEGKDHGAKTDAQDSVHEEAADHREDDVGPGVPGVEVGELRGGQVHRHLDVRLQSSRIVEAEI